MMDVAHQLTGQIADRSENAASNQMPFDLSEPQFHLVQPGRVGRCKVEPHVGMIEQKSFHALRFVSSEIVHNHMDLALGRLTGHQVGSRSPQTLGWCAGRRFSPQHLAGPSVEGGIQR